MTLDLGTGEPEARLRGLVEDFVGRINGKQTVYQLIELAGQAEGPRSAAREMPGPRRPGAARSAPQARAQAIPNYLSQGELLALLFLCDGHGQRNRIPDDGARRPHARVRASGAGRDRAAAESRARDPAANSLGCPSAWRRRISPLPGCASHRLRASGFAIAHMAALPGCGRGRRPGPHRCCTFGRPASLRSAPPAACRRGSTASKSRRVPGDLSDRQTIRMVMPPSTGISAPVMKSFSARAASAAATSSGRPSRWRGMRLRVLFSTCS